MKTNESAGTSKADGVFFMKSGVAPRRARPPRPSRGPTNDTGRGGLSGRRGAGCAAGGRFRLSVDQGQERLEKLKQVANAFSDITECFCIRHMP